MNRVRSLTDEERVKSINDENNIFTPPPLDIDCDCEENDHFHFKTLDIKCDKCQNSDYKNDYFAYTNEEALEKFHQELEENGWGVHSTLKGYFYFCGDCLMKAVQDNPTLKAQLDSDSYNPREEQSTIEDIIPQQNDNLDELLKDI